MVTLLSVCSVIFLIINITSARKWWILQKKIHAVCKSQKQNLLCDNNIDIEIEQSFVELVLYPTEVFFFSHQVLFICVDIECTIRSNHVVVQLYQLMWKMKMKQNKFDINVLFLILIMKLNERKRKCCIETFHLET